MKKSEQLFETMKMYSELYETSKEQELPMTAERYQKLANNCRKEALQALAYECKEVGE